MKNYHVLFTRVLFLMFACVFGLHAYAADEDVVLASGVSLKDRAEIHDLISLYAIMYDGKDVKSYSKLFAEDAEMRYLDNVIKGRDAIYEWAKGLQAKRPSYMATGHYTLNTVLYPIDTDHVKARSMTIISMQDTRQMEGAGNQVRGFAYYEDVLVRTNVGWRFQKRHGDVWIPLDPDFAKNIE